MYKIESIRENLLEKGVVSYQIAVTNKVFLETMWFICFEEFVQFIKEQEIKQVFICEKYVNNEEYLITKETMRKINVCPDNIEYLFDLIDEYNAVLLDKEIQIPMDIGVFCGWNNQRFGFLFQNQIMVMDRELLPAEKQLQLMIEENSEAIFEYNKAIEYEKERMLDKLKKYILSDNAFKKCTNSRLRRAYLKEILQNEYEYNLVYEMWKIGDNGLYHDAIDFIEKLWKECK